MKLKILNNDNITIMILFLLSPFILLLTPLYFMIYFFTNSAYLKLGMEIDKPKYKNKDYILNL